MNPMNQVNHRSSPPLTWWKFTTCLAGTFLVISFNAIQAQTIVPTSITSLASPYSATLTSNGKFSTANVGFSTGSDAWTQTSGGYQSGIVSMAGGTNQSSAATQVTPLGTASSANDWTESIDFNLSNVVVGTTEDMGVGALGTGSSFIRFAGGNEYFAFVSTVSHTLQIDSIISNSFVTLGSTTLTLATADPYQLLLQGTYDGSGNLTLTAYATDETTGTQASVSTSSIASPLTGKYFGLFNYLGNGAAATINYDDFNIALGTVPPVTVPEPSSYALLILGGGVLSLIGLRRRSLVQV